MNYSISILQNIALIIISLFGLGLIVAFHEFGHFIFAKLFNVSTPSFSIGFGPRLIEKKIGETTFAISAIPVGGYVEIAGNEEVGQGEQKEANRNDERSFNQKTYLQKLLIMLGGILFNFIFAYLALSFAYYIGMPSNELMLNKLTYQQKPYVAFVSKKETTKIEPNDLILSIDNIETKTIKEAIDIINKNPDKEVIFKVQRDSNIVDIPVKLTSTGKKENNIGKLAVFWKTKTSNISEAFKAGFYTTNNLSKQVVKALTSLFSGKSEGTIGGPITIIHQLKESINYGLSFFIFVLAFISINLALLNFIPLPIFDGGQILFVTIESIIGRPLPENIRYKIHYYNWIFVLALLIYLSYKDITRITGLDKYLNKETISKLFSK